ncbi:MAG: AraC family transcriptional regulator [Sphingobacteriales bacterium 50-39]|nr:helix-turn-helix domain-containing protein [Sphingobacteriales bacterium]OJW59877.1 MAG: AraC family transcriptional regulator [Sphingobacteriales bacterium 50-39]
MYIQGEDQKIPNYAFEPHRHTGNQMFRINRLNISVNYEQRDFLVPHRKDYYFMALIKSGSSRHWIDMTPYSLKPDTFYFTVPHQVHLKEEMTPLTGIIVCFTSDFLATDYEGSLRSLPIIQNPFNGHELSLDEGDLLFVQDILEKLLVEYDTKSDWQHTMLLSYMRILLVYLSRLYLEQLSERGQGEDRQLLKKYLAKIEESYRQLHEVADYASQLHISPGHLGDVIKEQSGKPAITHIHERLTLEAKRLLFHTDQVIKEIAFHLGFEDASYFSRFFKRMTGHTPQAYRDNFREMYQPNR